MIEIEALENGAHRNQYFHGELPEGWAIIPEDMIVPDTFPFVNIEVEEKTYYNEVPAPTEEGVSMTQEAYTMLTVTKMTEGTLPEPQPEPITPDSTADEVLDALLGV